MFKSKSEKYNIPDSQITDPEEEDVIDRAKDWFLVQDEDNTQYKGSSCNTLSIHD